MGLAIVSKSKRENLERRTVVIPDSGHGLCPERFAQRVIYRGRYRLTLCAHTESDVRPSIVPRDQIDDDTVRWMVEEIERFQRRLGAER